jgi:hypothetical protein
MGAFETVMSGLGPYAWAKLNETGATAFANSGSQGGTISVQGTWTKGATGIDSTNGASTPTGQLIFSIDPFRSASSFSMWFKRTGGTNSVGRNLIEAYTSSSYNMDSVGECGINTSGYVQFGPRYSTAMTSMTSNVNVLDGNWHHIAFTRNGTTAKIYIDGNLTNTGTAGSGTSTTTVSTYIGLATADGTNTYDEVAYFQKELTAAEVASLYSGSTATNINYTDTAGMATATPHALMIDPAISLQSNVQYTADPSTASADTVSPTVSADSSAEYAADASTASSEMVDSTVEAIGNVEHTETAWTASAEMADPTVSAQIYVSVAADPMDASSLSPANIFFGVVVEDTDYTVQARQIIASIANQAVTTSFTIGTDNAGGGGKVSLALKPNSGFPPANKIVKAVFHPTQVTASTAADASPSNTFNIYVFTANPSSNFQSMTYADLPAKELLYATRLTDDGVSFKPDLTAAFNDARSHDYGILIEHVGTGGSSYDRTEFSVPNGVDDSLLYILSSDVVSKNLNADAITASGEMVDPSTTTINNLDLAADVVTANAEMVDPVGTTSQNTSFTDSPWTASAEFVDPAVAAELIVTSGHLEADSLMVDPTLDIEGTYIYYSTEPVGTASAEFMSVGWNIGEDNVAVHMDASASMVDPSLRADNLQYANETNGHLAEMLDPSITVVLNSQTVNATPMEANIAFPNPVYSRALDPYYSRIRELLGDDDNAATAKPSYLFIFDGLDSDTYGWKPTIKNANWTSFDGDYTTYGVTAGGIVPAPGGRRAQTLTNTGVTYSMGLYDSTGRYDGSKSAVEAVLRVSEANAGQFYQRRFVSSIGGGSEVRLSINNGKIRFELWSAGSRTGFNFVTAYEGFKNIADGQWHHIIVNFSDDVVNGPNYFDIYVDGQRDFKRFQGMSNATKGRPSSLVANFTGDIQSIAHYELELSQDDIVKNYYLALDIDAIEAEPMIATLADIVQPKRVRGNRVRMLMLYTGYAPGFYPDGYRVREGGQLITDGKEFDYDFGPTLPVSEDLSTSIYWGDVDVFTQPILGPWRDAISDDFRTIDLRTDVSLADFDIVSFRDYPNESTEYDRINTLDLGGTTGARLRDVWQKERETFARNLLLAINQTGTSLYVNDPQLAIDLGIVDKVVQISDNVGRGGDVNNAGNGAGAFDPRSYDIDPFVGNGRGTGITPAINQGLGFSDTHTYAFHRIINEVDGITDSSSRSGKYYIKNLTRYIPYSPFEIDRYSFKYGQAALNEDFYVTNAGLHGTVGGPYYRQQQFAGTGDRWNLILVPPSNVKSGKIVTAISPTYYDGRSSTANPYSGYATTIAVEPGQNISGIQMNAKVFVSFAEPMQSSAPNSALRYQDQTKPITDLDADQVDFMWGGEAANWQYSTFRQTTTLQNINTTYASSYGPATRTSGEAEAGRTGLERNVAGRDTVVWVSLNLPVIEIYNNYQEGLYTQFTASNAGWRWLSTPIEIAENDSIQRPIAMTATAEIVDATVELEVNNEIFATTMVASATIVQATNYGLPDALALALPMTVFAQMPSIVKVVYADPMTATTNLGQNFTITVSGEMVVLTLPHSDAVLYIKENISN